MRSLIAERASKTCLPDSKVITASNKGSPISSIRLSELSLPERWKSHSPIKLIEPSADTVPFGDAFLLEDLMALEEAQSHGSFETAHHSSTPSFDSDEWVTDEEASVDDSCDSLSSFEDQLKSQGRIREGKFGSLSFEEQFDGEKLNLLGESDHLYPKPERPKSAENLAIFDSKPGTSRQSKYETVGESSSKIKRKDSQPKTSDVKPPKAEISPGKKGLMGVSKLSKDAKEDGQFHLGSGENFQPSFSYPPIESKARSPSHLKMKSSSEMEKRHRSKGFVKSILESAAKLKTEWKEPKLPKQGMSEEWEEIEREFQTEDMKAATNAFKKMAKAVRNIFKINK